MAVHRKGKNLQLRLQSLGLKAGDTLLFLGSEKNIDELRESENVVLLDSPPLPVEKQIFKSIGVIAILCAIIFFASSSIIPLSLASVIGVTALIATRLINFREAFKAVEWNIVALIYAMLAVGVTMQKNWSMRSFG